MPNLAAAPTATATVALPPAAPIDPTAAPAEPTAVPEPPAPTEVPPEPTVAPPPPAAPVVVAPTSPPPPRPTATPVPAPPPPVAPPAATGLNGMEAAMFNQHNQLRGAAGPLRVDPQLTAIARQRAQDMASKNYFAHTSPTGQTAFTLMNGAGYAYAIAGENIARNNYPDSESVSVAMNGFMNSPSHRDNIMDGRYTKVGIGVAIDASGMKYFAVVFAG